MADIQLSDQDIDYIARVVATEVPARVRRDPMEYNRMVGAVVDTVTNRLATGRYGSSVKEVLNQNRAFSKITGPARIGPYGSVENAPRAPKFVQNAVNEHIASRRGGKPREIGGATDYANPNYSDASNLRRWVNPMIAAGATKVGRGKSVHYHGTSPGGSPAPSYRVQTPGDFMPSIEQNMSHNIGVPLPSPRQPMAQMAAARAFDRGGILDAPKVSFNPLSSAQAGERQQVSRSPLPAIQDRTRPMPTGAVKSGKTSSGISFSIPQSTPVTKGGYSDTRPMPYGPMAAQANAAAPMRDRPMPTGPIAQPMIRDRPMPTGPLPRVQPAPVAPSPVVSAGYQQYGQTRALAPSLPASTPQTVQDISGPLGQSPMIAAPITQTPSPEPEKPKNILQKVFSPENLKKAGGAAIGGAVAGPIGGIIGGLLADSIGNKQGGQGGLLAGLSGMFGGGRNPYQGQSTYVGNGVNAVDRAMYGNRRGDTATYNSQGGGSVTNLGNGEHQRTSSKYGWTETTHRDGSKSISYKK